MINNGHESMYKHGGRYLDCRFFPLPGFFVLCFFFLFLFRAFIRSNGLAHGYPLFGWQIAFCLYTTIYHISLNLFTHIKKVVDRKGIWIKQRL